MYSHLHYPTQSLGLTLSESLNKLEARRLKSEVNGTLSSRTWEGCILKNGIPVVEISMNGRVWRLSRKLQSSNTIARAVWSRGNCLGAYEQSLLADTVTLALQLLNPNE